MNERALIATGGITYPHWAHQGGAKKVIADQQRPHNAQGSPTVVPQARQRRNAASTTARPRWVDCA